METTDYAELVGVLMCAVDVYIYICIVVLLCVLYVCSVFAL